MLIPIFKSHYSIGKSILTLDKPKSDSVYLSEYKKIHGLSDDVKVDRDCLDDFFHSKPISIFTIAEKHNLDKIYLLEDKFGGFFEAWGNAEKLNKQLVYGISFILCSDSKEKTEESRSTESKVGVWIKNSQGYKDLIKMYSEIHSKEENFYYYNRGDWNILNKYWTDNLVLTIPFYDSFLFNNKFYGANCIPNFPVKPIMVLEDHSTCFDFLHKDIVLEYAKKEGLKTENFHTVYYYSKKQFEAFQVFRCIQDRNSLETPNLECFSSQEFSFTSYLEKIK